MAAGIPRARKEVVMKVEERIERHERQLAELDGKLSELGRALERAEAKLREDLAPELEALHKQHQELAEQLAGLRLEKAESWADEDLEEGLLRIFDDIGGRVTRLGERVA